MQAEALQEKLERIFAEQRRALVGVLSRMVGNVATAEELAHEAYLRVSAAAAADMPVAAPQAYLYQIARNLAIDHIRRNALEGRIFAADVDAETVSEIAGPSATPEDLAAYRESLAILDAALATVPPRAREVLMLSRLHGLSYDKISVRLGISPTTVHKDFQRALAACVSAATKHDLF